MTNRIQFRRDTAANWTAANPVLSSGEPARETDTGRQKQGDGTTAWNSLPYLLPPYVLEIANVAPGTELLAAVNSAVAARRAVLANVRADAAGTRVIDLPAGDITLTDARALLGRETMPEKISGLKFRGAGSSLTTVIFNPATATDALLFNDYWMDVRFEGITFVTLQAGATFMQSYTTHSAQDYTFTDVSWIGPWKYVFDLQGDNNNSEYRFFGCATSGLQAGGAFLYIGSSGSDQFLNYWFYGFKHWSTSAALIDAVKGGHFHFYGLDVSNWGSGLSSTDYIFKLKGTSHALGVLSLTVHGMRAEAMSALGALLYSEWNYGTIFIDCDWGSQTYVYTYGEIVTLDVGNDSGPLTVLTGTYAGTIGVRYGAGQWAYQSSLTVRDAVWMQKSRPSDVVTYTATGGVPNHPAVNFVNVRPDSAYTNPFSVAGASVWDARVGGSPLVSAQPLRSVLLQQPWGGVNSTTDSIRVKLPIGALVTGFSMGGAPGGNGSTGGTWTFKNAETTPVTIAAVNVNTDLTVGFQHDEVLTIPYLCSTDTKATIDLKVTLFTAANPGSYLTINGYW